MPINKIKLNIPDAAKPLLKDPTSTVYSAFQRALLNVGRKIQENVKRNIVPGWNMGHQTRLPLFHGSAGLSGTIVYQLTGLRLQIGHNRIYGDIQEYGGIIRPKKAKALFIPMSIKGQKTGARKGGSDLEYGTDFIFKQQVEIKPKRYFERGMEASIDSIMSTLETMLNKIGGTAGLQ